MFAVLQINPDKDTLDEVETGVSRGACVHCHAKKIKCTSQLSGCNRCVSKGLQCQYRVQRVGKGARIRNNATAKSRDSAHSRSSRPASFLGASKGPGEETENRNDAASGVLKHPSVYTSNTELTQSRPEAESSGHERDDEEIMSNSLAAEPFLYDEHLNYSYETPYETDINMLSMENELGLNFWENLNPHDTDVSFTNPPDLPSVPPSKSGGNQPTPAISPTTEEHTTGDAPTTNSSCQCVMDALSLLEATSIQNVSITLPSVSSTLRLNKNALTRYKRLMACQNCSAQSSFVMLLIVVSQNLMDAYETVLKLLGQQFNELCVDPSYPLDPEKSSTLSRQSPGHQESIANPPQSLNDSLPPANLHGYELDPTEEPCVFGGLTQWQLTLLQSFVNRIRHILRSWNWDGHLPLVEAVSMRIKEQLGLFGRSCSPDEPVVVFSI